MPMPAGPPDSETHYAVEDLADRLAKQHPASKRIKKTLQKHIADGVMKGQAKVNRMKLKSGRMNHSGIRRARSA